MATVAGKLLLEKESSPVCINTTSNEKGKCRIGDQEFENGNTTLKMEPLNQGSSEGKFAVSELKSEGYDVNCSSKESFVPKKDDHSGFTSIMITSNSSERLVTNELTLFGYCL